MRLGTSTAAKARRQPELLTDSSSSPHFPIQEVRSEERKKESLPRWRLKELGRDAMGIEGLLAEKGAAWCHDTAASSSLRGETAWCLLSGQPWPGPRSGICPAVRSALCPASLRRSGLSPSWSLRLTLFPRQNMVCDTD